MCKILLFSFCLMVLAACSSEKAPVAPKEIVLENCSDARDFAYSNHQKIEEAFANNDANTIGSLELENRALINSNPECFPKEQEIKKFWAKKRKEMGM